jgi:hypothetical protein
MIKSMEIMYAGYLVQNERMRKCIHNLVENTEGRKTRGRHGVRRESNIKMDFIWRGKNWTVCAEFCEEECPFENCFGYCGSIKV